MFVRASAYALCAGMVLSWLSVALSAGVSALWNPFDVLFIGVISGGPAVLVACPVAGYLASRGASSTLPWSRAEWISRGFRAGAVTGGVSLGGWFAVMNMSYDVRPWELAGMVVVGSVAGACAGVAVGHFCWRRLRSQLAV